MVISKRNLADNIYLAIIIFAIVYVAWVIKPGAEDLWSRWRDFTSPNYKTYVLSKWADKPTDFLITKLKHPSYIYSDAARVILYRRKDSPYEAKVVKLIESNNLRVSAAALDVLFSWNEQKAIELSMLILKSGRSHLLFNDALLHLSKRKYEPAYPYAVELAKAADKYNNGSDAYLADYGEMESLPILEEMLREAPTSLDRRAISRAIQSIKKQNGIIDQ